MSQPLLRPRRSKAFWVLLLGAALFFAGLVALGSWQVQRLAWKQDLIARVDARLAAAPVPPPPPSEWRAVDKAGYEYRKLRLRGRFDHGRETLVGASTELGTGFWVITPLQITSGEWLLVNRGFVPPELADPARRPPAGAQDAEVELTGLLRLSEPRGRLWQHNDASAGRWYSRDVPAIAAARGLSGAIAPFFVDAMAASPSGAEPVWPRAGLTVVRFSNNHRVYALTWFALAAMVLVATGYLLREERQRRLAGERPSAPHDD
jgi:surfeit locus 1 family protein